MSTNKAPDSEIAAYKNMLPSMPNVLDMTGNIFSMPNANTHSMPIADDVPKLRIYMKSKKIWMVIYVVTAPDNVID